MPGMSSLDDKGKWVVVVIDADDAFTAQKIEEYWGRTPGRVNTRRGKHFCTGCRVGQFTVFRKSSAAIPV
jgi:hypothetical protein